MSAASEIRAQSNARVSAYLQALADNELFVDPDLTFVRSNDDPANPQESFDYSLAVRLRSPLDEEAEAGFEQFDNGGAN